MKILFYFFIACILLDKALLQSQDYCEKRIYNICYEDNSYPAKEIQSRWQKIHRNEQGILGKLLDTTIEQEDAYTSCSLCETSQSLRIQPLSLLHPTEKVYIMSTANYPRPIIDIKICKKDRNCMIENLHDDYVPKCVQKMSKINVLTYNVTSKEFVGVQMSYPSACECILEG